MAAGAYEGDPFCGCRYGFHGGGVFLFEEESSESFPYFIVCKIAAVCIDVETGA